MKKTPATIKKCLRRLNQTNHFCDVAKPMAHKHRQHQQTSAASGRCHRQIPYLSSRAYCDVAKTNAAPYRRTVFPRRKTNRPSRHSQHQQTSAVSGRCHRQTPYLSSRVFFDVAKTNVTPHRRTVLPRRKDRMESNMLNRPMNIGRSYIPLWFIVKRKNQIYRIKTYSHRYY
jgi:hypothetical protein